MKDLNSFTKQKKQTKPTGMYYSKIYQIWIVAVK